MDEVNYDFATNTTTDYQGLVERADLRRRVLEKGASKVGLEDLWGKCRCGLDLGVGQGEMLMAMAELVPQGEFTAVDAKVPVIPELATQMEERLDERRELIGDYLDDLEGKCFDVVTMSCVHWMDHGVSDGRQLAGVLSPGGVVVDYRTGLTDEVMGRCFESRDTGGSVVFWVRKDEQLWSLRGRMKRLVEERFLLKK